MDDRVLPEVIGILAAHGHGDLAIRVRELMDDRAARPLPSGDLREAVEVVEKFLTKNPRSMMPWSANVAHDAIRVVLAHVTGWVEITDEASLPKDDEEYLWRFSHTGTYRAGKCKSSDRGHYGMYSHYKRITPPTETT